MQIYACVNYFHDKNIIHRHTHKIAMWNSPSLLCRFISTSHSPYRSWPSAFSLTYFLHPLLRLVSATIYLRKEMHSGAVFMFKAIFILRTVVDWEKLNKRIQHNTAPYSTTQHVKLIVSIPTMLYVIPIRGSFGKIMYAYVLCLNLHILNGPFLVTLQCGWWWRCFTAFTRRAQLYQLVWVHVFLRLAFVHK